MKRMLLSCTLLSCTLLSCTLACLTLPATAWAAPANPTMPSSSTRTTDCASAQGPGATCRRVPCNSLMASFAGAWSGNFHAYVRKKSTPAKPVFRPYHDSVTYATNSCLQNTASGDTFIVGHQVDSYPAFEGLPATTEKSLLILGHHADGKQFMRTVDPRRGSHDYTLAFEDHAADLAIWRLKLPAAHGQPPMTFDIIDARDFAALPKRGRNVTVTMRLGPAGKPYWQGVLAYGTHVLGK